MQELRKMRFRSLSWDVLKASISTHFRRIQQQITSWAAWVKASFRIFSAGTSGISGASQLYCK